MTRPKRTAEELRIEILEKIKEMEDNADENDINKTRIANAVGINNTLATSLLDGMEETNVVKRDSFGNYTILRGGEGLLEITKIGWEKTGKILKIAHEIARMEPINDIEVIKENKKTIVRMCVFCNSVIGENDETNRHEEANCKWDRLRKLLK